MNVIYLKGTSKKGEVKSKLANMYPHKYDVIKINENSY